MKVFNIAADDGFYAIFQRTPENFCSIKFEIYDKVKTVLIDEPQK